MMCLGKMSLSHLYCVLFLVGIWLGSNIRSCNGFVTPSFVVGSYNNNKKKNNVRVMEMSSSMTVEKEQETIEALMDASRKRYEALFPPPSHITIQHSESVYFTHVSSYPDEKELAESKEEDVMKRVYNNPSVSKEKPVLIFLPGLDGVGVSASTQFESLCEDWDVWRMAIDPSSAATQPTYLELTNSVTDFLVNFDDRDVYLMGESFGGLLTTTVALRAKTTLKGLILINPATSFEDTSWSNIVPLIQALNNPRLDPNNLAYSAVASAIFSYALIDNQQWSTLTSIIGNNWRNTNLPSILTDALQIVGKRLPPSTLQHRLKSWLPVGSQLMTPKRLQSIQIPTLIMTGDQDRLLPSGKERRRLANLIPNCESVSFQNAGHVPLFNDDINLSKLILESDIFFPSEKKKYDPIVDWKLPSPDVIQSTIESNVQPLRDATSPIFFSTNSKTGKRVRGLSQLPSQDNNGNPVLYVANHQLLGLDLGMIIAQLLEERDITVRGLAHPFIFNTQNIPGNNNDADKATRVITNNNDVGGFLSTKVMQTFGAVMVTPRNYYRLMQTGQTALLFPGGVREVFHGKDEAYKLFWPENKVDFVRTAAKFNATIVPLSAVGAADSANILIDAPDMKRLFNTTNNNIAARYDVNNEDELFQPPLVVPKILPARHYFVFGKSVDTTNISPFDKDACKEVYEQIQEEMYRGFNDILDARKEDIYHKEPLRRLALERISGKQAPTFPLELLNKESSSPSMDKETTVTEES